MVRAAPAGPGDRTMTRSRNNATKRVGAAPVGLFNEVIRGDPWARGTRSPSRRKRCSYGEAEALTRKGGEMALACDTTALRLCLDRNLPRRERPVNLKLPNPPLAHGLTRAIGGRTGFPARLIRWAAGKLVPL